MSYTPKYNLYVTDDENEKFLDWRRGMNATTDSNMTKIEQALANAEAANADLQEQIDAITSQSDVVDVVGTKAELDAYSKPLYVDNIVKVLVDETKSNSISYYRWKGSEAQTRWEYIGSQGPFYTKVESDSKFASLGEDGKVKEEQLPPFDYIPLDEKGVSGGVASLDEEGKVPNEQLPFLNYIPNGEKGAPEGVATLNEDGKIPLSQLNEDDLGSNITIVRWS